MKKVLFFLALSIFTFKIYSQNITLDEVINLRNKDVTDVEEYLTNKNWTLLNAKEGYGTTMASIGFAYNKSSYDDRAESFIKYYYSDETETKRISWQINRKDKYSILLGQLKAKGVTLLNTKVKDGSIIKYYQGKTLTFVVSIDTDTDYIETKTTYNIFIITNYDYLINFADE
ncbi:MAG: hypothetical protein JST29_13070 [Bacteroidetes bacterium]|nr:hypothetical protein [Bacteroidota bacterium]